MYYKNNNLDNIVFFCLNEMKYKTETWKEIKNYNGFYFVSSFGRIKSVKRKSNHSSLNGFCYKKERILKQTKSGKYLTVGLCVNCKKITFTTHSLVAQEYFNHKISGREIQVDHIKEGDKLDNSIYNLQLLTASENSLKYINEIKKLK